MEHSTNDDTQWIRQSASFLLSRVNFFQISRIWTRRPFSKTSTRENCPSSEPQFLFKLKLVGQACSAETTKSCGSETKTMVSNCSQQQAKLNSHVITLPFWTPALVSFCFRVVGFHAIRSISCLLFTSLGKEQRPLQVCKTNLLRTEKSQMPVYCLPHSWTSVTFCCFLLLRWCILFLSSSFSKLRLSSLSYPVLSCFY